MLPARKISEISRSLDPSFPRCAGRGRGFLAAEAVVPPSPPSNVFGYRGGSPLYPPAGAAPPAPCAAPVASLRWRIGTLPSLPPGAGTGTVFDCMLLSFSAEFRGLQAWSRHNGVTKASGAVTERQRAVMDRRAVVAEAQRTAAEPRGWKGLVWKRHWHWSHLSSDGRGARRRFLRCAATGGFSVVSPRSEMYAAGFMGLL